MLPATSPRGIMDTNSLVGSLWQIPVLILAASLFVRNGHRMSVIHRDLCFGAVLGLCAIVMMLAPALTPGTEGVVLGLHCLPVAFAAALIDFRAASVTLCITIAVRVLLGGEIAAAVLSLIAALVAGGLWRTVLRPHIPLAAIRLPILGVMVSLHLVGVVLLPEGLRERILRAYGPQYMVLNFMATILFGTIVKRELILMEYRSLMLRVRRTLGDR